ncbi:hypothetical protein CFOL_v3_34214, partial [Cephalotus follicularis]|jgi:hypothetical protein
VKSH